MSSFTENLYLKRQIQQLEEQNNNLKRLINEAAETPTQSGLDSAGRGSYQTGGYAYPGTKDYGLTNAQSPLGYGRQQGGNQTGGPLYIPGYLPPNIINVVMSTLEENGIEPSLLIDYQNGQINWANWALQANNNPQFISYIGPLVIQAINGQLGSSAAQQFATAFRQWQASQSRR